MWWNKLLITYGLKNLILSPFFFKYSAQHWQYYTIAISVGVVDKHEREQHVSIFQRKLNSCPAVMQMRRTSKPVWYAKWLPILYFAQVAWLIVIRGEIRRANRYWVSCTTLNYALLCQLTAACMPHPSLLTALIWQSIKEPSCSRAERWSAFAAAVSVAAFQVERRAFILFPLGHCLSEEWPQIDLTR